MLSTKFIFFCLISQINFFGINFHLKSGIVDNSYLGGLCLSYGGRGSYTLEMWSNFNVQRQKPLRVPYTSIDVQFFELRSSYQPSSVCAADDVNELLNLILSLQNMCMIYKCSPDWDDFCECKNDALIFVVPSTYDMRSTLKCSPNWDVICEYEINVLTFVIPLSKIMRKTFKCSPDCCNFRHNLHHEVDVLKFITPLSLDLCTCFFIRDGLYEVACYENGVCIFTVVYL